MIKDDRSRTARCGFFLCAPGRAHLLRGESPPHTREGEVLAEGKGVAARWGPEEAGSKTLA